MHASIAGVVVGLAGLGSARILVKVCLLYTYKIEEEFIMKINNINLMTSTEEVIRIFDDASDSWHDSYATVWWSDGEAVIAEPYALCFPDKGESHRQYFNRELPADFKVL